MRRSNFSLSAGHPWTLIVNRQPLPCLSTCTTLRLSRGSGTTPYRTASTRIHHAAPFSTNRQSLADEVNPPATTLPPPLDLPIRQPQEFVGKYLFQLGRAYGKFYYAGMKLTWTNHKRAKTTKQEFENLHQWASTKHADFARLGKSTQDLTVLAIAIRRAWERKDIGSIHLQPAEKAFLQSRIGEANVTRSRFQILVRDDQDWRKVPQFGLLVLICGEYLPLLVPFIPGMVPRTCRIPKQIQGMRRTREERKKQSFEDASESLSRQATSMAIAAAETSAGQLSASMSLNKHLPNSIMTADCLVDALNSPQILHLSTLLDCHGRWWARLGLSPPQWLVGPRVKRALRYIAIDDCLLQQNRGSVDALTADEVDMACEDRAMDVSGRDTTELRRALKSWLQQGSVTSWQNDLLVKKQS